MRRREFVAGLSGAAVWPVMARAQQRLPMIGVLRIGPKEVEWFADQFRDDMKELGWEEGRNICCGVVWAGGRNEQVPALARDLVAREADIILTFGNLGTLAVQRATGSRSRSHGKATWSAPR